MGRRPTAWRWTGGEFSNSVNVQLLHGHLWNVEYLCFAFTLHVCTIPQTLCKCPRLVLLSLFSKNTQNECLSISEKVQNPFLDAQASVNYLLLTLAGLQRKGKEWKIIFFWYKWKCFWCYFGLGFLLQLLRVWVDISDGAVINMFGWGSKELNSRILSIKKLSKSLANNTP